MSDTNELVERLESVAQYLGMAPGHDEEIATITAAIAALAPVEAVPVDSRDGCEGSMTPERVAYFLRRFKNEEKLLGPHEQWALDVAIAAFDAHPPAQAGAVTEAWLRDTAMNVMLATEVDEAIATLRRALTAALGAQTPPEELVA